MSENGKKMPKAPGKGSKKSKLTFPQRFQVVEALRANLDHFTRGRMSYKQVWDFLVPILGFPFTVGNLASITTEMGITWPRSNRGNPNLNRPSKKELVAAVRFLYEKLGLEVPDCLQPRSPVSQD